MNWLFSLGSGFLTSKLSGWIALAAVSAIFALWWRYDYITDQLAKCRADTYLARNENPEIRQITDELKRRSTEEFDALRDRLDDAEHPCLDWVYDPYAQADEGSAVRDPRTGE